MSNNPTHIIYHHKSESSLCLIVVPSIYSHSLLSLSCALVMLFQLMVGGLLTVNFIILVCVALLHDFWLKTTSWSYINNTTIVLNCEWNYQHTPSSPKPLLCFGVLGITFQANTQFIPKWAHFIGNSIMNTFAYTIYVQFYNVSIVLLN